MRGSCGGAEKMSSSVVEPTAIAPESKSDDGALENPTSFTSVGVPPAGVTPVATLPPDGGTGAFVKLRRPSPPDTQTTM